MQNAEFQTLGQTTRSFRQKRPITLNDFIPKQLTKRLHTIQVQVTGGQKICTEVIYLELQTAVRLF